MSHHCRDAGARGTHVGTAYKHYRACSDMDLLLMIPFGSPHIFLQEGLLPVKQRITCCVEELKEELPVQPIVLGILGLAPASAALLWSSTPSDATDPLEIHP